MLGTERYNCKRTTVASGEFHFVRAIRVAHHHRPDLATPQKQGSVILEVLRTHILQQCYYVVHFDFPKHV